MTDIATATCPVCDRSVPAEELVDGACSECSQAAAPASVRPPDHLAEVRPQAPSPDERDPLAGWDAPGAVVEVAMPPPPTWAVLAGFGGFAGLAGLVAGLASGGTGLRRGLAWALVGTTTAAVVLRVWELEPEHAEWARTSVGAGPTRG